MSVDLCSGRVKYISGRVEILVSLPTQNAGRRHASCGERAWTSTCPPPVSTMAGRLIDKLPPKASLAEARSGPSCERYSLSIRTRPIACSTSRIQYFALSLHHQCRLSSYPSPTSTAICPISSATASSSPRHAGRYLPYLRYTEEEAVTKHAIEQLHVPHTMR